MQQIDKGEILPFSSTAKWAGKKIAEQIVGSELPDQPSLSESLKQTTDIKLSALPEIRLERAFEYQSANYKREGAIREELGAKAVDLFLLVFSSILRRGSKSSGNFHLRKV